MKIVYCNDDLIPRTVDSCSEKEYVAASNAGLHIDLLDFSAVCKGDTNTAVRLVKLPFYEALATRTI